MSTYLSTRKSHLGILLRLQIGKQKSLNIGESKQSIDKEELMYVVALSKDFSPLI